MPSIWNFQVGKTQCSILSHCPPLLHGKTNIFLFYTSRWPYRRIKQEERVNNEMNMLPEPLSFPSAEREMPPPPSFPTVGYPAGTTGQGPLRAYSLPNFAKARPLSPVETGAAGTSPYSSGLSTPLSPSDLTLPKLRVPKPEVFLPRSMAKVPKALNTSAAKPSEKMGCSPPALVLDVLRRAQLKVHGPAAQAFLAQQMAAAVQECKPAAPGPEGNFTSPFFTVQQPEISLKQRMVNILRFALSYRVQAAWQQQQLQASLSAIASTPGLQSEVMEAMEEHKRSTYEDIAALEKAAMELFANLSHKEKSEFSGRTALNLQPTASAPAPLAPQTQDLLRKFTVLPMERSCSLPITIAKPRSLVRASTEALPLRDDVLQLTRRGSGFQTWNGALPSLFQAPSALRNAAVKVPVWGAAAQNLMDT